ncbi:prephenate dehydrogenase [Tepidiforma thermophila]|uniref:Prephenate dehydrogenase n=1 Tax=Tepidiforma thermophila (strain KCTC 52669 / CGMCC 1.13589 / G233) TaxID=2761530 RepID=A0A2A9HEH9_TEPT2|nr:prephenate dehydrogenase/arogenate dehydrogenase family protein [Tepidiforma thermophila]PFG74427.1 prephenate dehydrogenase [Tepidiforma thermophila]
MAENRIAIIGTGLIGASIGLGLAARPNRNYEIVGVDRDRSHARTAKKLGALDREVGSLEEAVDRAGMVIVATPVMAARRILEDVGRYLVPGAVVTDVCSTKAEVMRWAAEYLPENVHFVGGHPMAGREKSGPEAASATLFQGATWAVTPSPRADERAVQAVLGLVEALGAVPLYIDPAEHDQYAAAVSHVPLLASVALFRMVRDSQGWEDAALLAGPGFRDVTRLASGDPTMARDIMLTNREAVLHWIGRLQQELSTIRAALEAGPEPVFDLFKSTQLDRDTFIQNPPQRRRPEGIEPPSARDAIGRMFVGGLYDKIKETTERLPATPRDDADLKRKLGIEDDRL